MIAGIDPVLFGIGCMVLAPFIGGLIAGLDRKITARMQGRVGPPLIQPFYDVLKLFQKEKVVVSRSQNFYVLVYLVFIAFTVGLFFSGGDLLLVIFALALAHIFLVLGAYAANSPYSYIGAERELIQLMSFEPMIIMVAVGMYMAAGSFFVYDIIDSGILLASQLPFLFIGFVYVLTIKLRKSPFDLSTSHHAHQELVKGVTTEFSGSTLGRIEIGHWYETVLMLGFIYLFFAENPLFALAAMALIYLLEIFIDNNYPRVKWPLALKSSWAVALVLGIINIVILHST